MAPDRPEGPQCRVLGDRPVVVIEPGTPLDVALKQLKRAYEAAGIGPELRRREAYVPPGERRRRKRRAALKRAAKAARRERRDG
jgi:small subunit ribosomal protein S21